MSTGTLYLIPVPLGGEDLAWTIPSAVRKRVAELDSFIVEHPKTARHFLKQIGCTVPLQRIHMQVLDEHTKPAEFESLLAPVFTGKDLGLLSEAGCPAVADPGAELVRLAYCRNVQVVPLVGPSSILLALMASGLNGQCFAFQGYLPAETDRRRKRIGELEKESILRDQTQIFIETPYRNQKLLESLLHTCQGETALCIASSLTLPGEFIFTKTIREWLNAPPDLANKPTVFLLHGRKTARRNSCQSGRK